MSIPAGFATFGKLVLEPDVDSAMLATLRLWFPDYLHALEEERPELSARSLARPQSGQFTSQLDDENFPEGTLPLVIVTTVQTAQPPQRDGDGRYLTGWSTRVSAVARGRTSSESKFVAACYGGCVRRILVQQAALLGLASEVVWIGGGVAPVADTTDNGRYLAASLNNFTVHVDQVLDGGDGPLTPTDPVNDLSGYDPIPPVGQVTTQIDLIGPDQNIGG